MTSTVSFSCTLETLNYLADWSTLKRMSRSRAIDYHIRMGKVYIQMLDESQTRLGEKVNEDKSQKTDATGALDV